jgi:hypothetical protein
MFAQAKLAKTVDRVKPERPRQREIGFAEPDTGDLGRRVGSGISPATSTIPAARCGFACPVVYGGPVRYSGLPYPDSETDNAPYTNSLQAEMAENSS